MQSSQVGHPYRYGIAGALALAVILLVAWAGTAKAAAGDAPAKPSPHPYGGVVVKTSTVPGVGDALVDFRGRTLYVFRGDKPLLYQFFQKPSPSCYEFCAEFWPPLLTNGAPKATPGVQGKLGTVTREDGTTQITYEGQPLYECSEDTEPGEANGQETEMFGEGWYAVDPKPEGA